MSKGVRRSELHRKAKRVGPVRFNLAGLKASSFPWHCPPGQVRDGSGTPVPGVQVNVAWDGDLDTFFTGLKPAVSAGYADFQMTPGVSYSLRVGDGGETLNGLSAPDCTDGGGNVFAGGLLLKFGR